jgi:hypothetical protein
VPARHVAQVELVVRRVRRIAGVADAVGALLDVHAGQLDLARDVRLGLRQLDLAALEHAAVALVLEVLLVGDEVGELLVVAEHHVERLRQPQLLEVDRLDDRVGDVQVIARAVDGVAGLDLDREIAAGARRHLQVALVAMDHAGGVEHAVLQLALVDVVLLGLVPVPLGGQKPLEEVDSLESLLLAHR